MGNIQPERWPHEYTNDLIDLLHVLTLVVQMEPQQADLLARLCAGPLVTAAEVEAAIGLDRPAAPRRRHDPDQTSMLE
ncbi:MAG TPA: hypothetical protein VIK25_14980 [Gemmatimonadaceae bacterium]